MGGVADSRSSLSLIQVWSVSTAIAVMTNIRRCLATMSVMPDRSQRGAAEPSESDMVAAFESLYPDLPPRGSVVERSSGRVVPIDDAGRVLLMRGCEPARPDVEFWFTVGGGIELGETTRQAACRELAEETGISVPEDQLGQPVHTWTNRFSFAKRQVVCHETTFGVAVRGSASLSTAAWDGGEVLTTRDMRWVDPASASVVEQTAGPAALLEQIDAAFRSLGMPSPVADVFADREVGERLV